MIAGEEPVQESREGESERDFVGNRLGKLDGFGDLGGLTPRRHAIVVLAAQEALGLRPLETHPVADRGGGQAGELTQLLDAELGELGTPFRA